MFKPFTFPGRLLCFVAASRMRILYFFVSFPISKTFSDFCFGIDSDAFNSRGP
jgi:hypothetical protein